MNKYIENRNLTLSEIYLHIGSYLIEVMRTAKMVDFKVYTSNGVSSTILVLDTHSIQELMGDKLNHAISIPFNLPMVVRPKKYSSGVCVCVCVCDRGCEEDIYWMMWNILSYAPLFNKKINYKTSSEIEGNKRVLYTLNKMMDTPFKINGGCVARAPNLY